MNGSETMSTKVSPAGGVAKADNPPQPPAAAPAATAPLAQAASNAPSSSPTPPSQERTQQPSSTTISEAAVAGTAEAPPPPAASVAVAASGGPPPAHQPPSSYSSATAVREGYFHQEHSPSGSSSSGGGGRSGPYYPPPSYQRDHHRHHQEYRQEYSQGSAGHSPYSSRSSSSSSSRHPRHHPTHYHGHGHHHQPPVRSVVTRDSFSMEEDREDHSPGSLSRHHYYRHNHCRGGGGAGADFHPPSSYSHHHGRLPPSDHHLRGGGPPLPPSHGGPHSDDYGPLDGPPPPSYYHHYSPGTGRDLPPVPEEGGDGRMMPPHHEMTTTMPLAGGPPSTVRIPPSPHGGATTMHDELSSPGNSTVIRRTHSVQSSHSTASGGPLKRSFWHHSRPEDASVATGGAVAATMVGSGAGGFEGTILPQEFIPPKRSKVASSNNSRRGREYYVVARPPPQAAAGRDDNEQEGFGPPPHRSSNHHDHRPRETDDDGAGMPPPPPPSSAATASATGVSTSNESSPIGNNHGTSTSNNHDINSQSNREWINSKRSMSWDARDDYYRRGDPRIGQAPSWASRSPPSRDGPSSGASSPYWAEAPYMPSPRSRYGPAMTMMEVGPYESTPIAGTPMNMSRQNSWMSSSSHSSITGVAWVTPSHQSGHPHYHHHSRQLSAEIPLSGGPPTSYPSWASNSPGGLVVGGPIRDDRDIMMRYDSRPQDLPLHHSHGAEKTANKDSITTSPSITNKKRTPSPKKKKTPSKAVLESLSNTPRTHPGKDGPIRLLALPEDQVSLSETLCIVRQNIEVFTATLEDVEAPAPGRKHAVVVGQVGLRCIHCRHTRLSSERVKRAVCYPSSIKRIYRTVIDMKLDHFLHCKFVPQNLKNTLNALKANNTRSTGTTMQYFIKAAAGMGMEDGPNGVRFVNGSPPPAQLVSPSPKVAFVSMQSAMKESTMAGVGQGIGQVSPPIQRTASLSSDGSPLQLSPSSTTRLEGGGNVSSYFSGEIPLALPEDRMSLSPLRCFLREQVCAFSATEEDIAVRTPTTFAVTVGQVGIGCIHCLHQPAKNRMNRAVCFPFSIGRIYQSVADIQRFHLGECKHVPKHVKDKFESLQSQSNKGSKGLATRQYWITSAKKIGLVDTDSGIRFGRDPNALDQKAVSLDILAQVASHVTTVNRPLVLPEDKGSIAEFLYVVMEQLQACRFTEADRNKRRLKDVGCIGVECKHCAGQVDGRKFFWSSVSAVESNFVSVHTHMLECSMVPEELKDRLRHLKTLRKEQTSALKTGSQKAFFARVWKRLHTEGKDEKGSSQIDSAEKASMHLTPMNSADSNDPQSSMNDEGSPNSLDSIEHLKAVTDNMAIVSV